MLNLNNLRKQPVFYGQRGLFKNPKKRLQIDVRSFIRGNDYLLEDVINKYKLKKSTMNETQWQIQKFVVSYLRYVYDEKTYNQEEFWEFPFETIYLGLGDCEDGQILMTSLMRVQGIPQNRVRVQQGLVQESPTSPTGGHQWTIYLQDLRNGKKDWVILDWCFYPDHQIPVERKSLLRNHGYKGTYKEIWFTFNDMESYSSMVTHINTGRISKVSEKTKFIKEYNSFDDYKKWIFTEQKGKFDLMNNQYLTEF